MNIDLNCDLGEGAGHDDELMPLITSANICCGAHAGDEADIRRTLALARDHGVVVGVHPGYADREHFGRREMILEETALFDLVDQQVAVLSRWAAESGVRLCYLKPHGALYNQACRDAAIARPIAAAAAKWGLPVLALPRSPFPDLVAEGFADRRYRADGSLVPRGQPDAFVASVKDAVVQAMQLAKAGIASLCVHGDNPEAITFVRELRRAFEAAGVTIKPFSKLEFRH